RTPRSHPGPGAAFPWAGIQDYVRRPPARRPSPRCVRIPIPPETSRSRSTSPGPSIHSPRSGAPRAPKGARPVRHRTSLTGGASRTRVPQCVPIAGCAQEMLPRRDAAGAWPNSDAAEAEVLDLEVLLQSVLRALTADAALFHATEGRHFSGDEARVDADHTALERLGDPPDAAHVTAVEVAGQPELSPVGQTDGIFLGRELHQRGDRAEGLFVHGERIAGDARQHRRLVEPARPCPAPSTDDRRGALGKRVGHMGFDLAYRLLLDQWSDARVGLEAIAHLQVGVASGEHNGEGWEDRSLQQNAVGASAGLAGVGRIR